MNLNRWEQCAGWLNLIGLAVFVFVIVFVMFWPGWTQAATAPIRPGPDPQFLPVEREAAPATAKAVSFGTYGGKRLQACPGRPAVFSDRCEPTRGKEGGHD